MAVTLAGGRRRAAALPPGWTVAVVLVAGALISGFTLLRGIDPFDEGLMLQAARRMANGQWPYSGFQWSYGPGQIALLAGTFKAFGTSLLWWRIVRAGVDALVGLAVFLFVRRQVGPRWALASWLVAVCAMAQPTSANPFPPALLFCLLAVLAAAAITWPERAAPAAGALVALAAFWRPDFGVYALAGAAATLVLRGDAGRRSFARFAAAAGGLTLLLWLPFVIAAGAGDVIESVVVRSLREGSYWRLPFPLSFDGSIGSAHGLKHLLAFYVPLIALVGIATAGLVALLRRRGSPALGGLTVLGAGFTLYLFSRTDAFHVTPLIVVLAAAVPLVVAEAPRALAVVAAGSLLLLGASGVSNRAAALFSPPSLQTLSVDVADGVQAPPADARALPGIVRLVRARVPPGQPIYVVPLRSDLVRINDPLLYVLVGRPNRFREDYALQTSDAAQRQIAAGLGRSRPRVVIRWLDPVSAQREPNRRGTPSGSRFLDGWLAAHYRVLRRDGLYVVLVPR